MELNTKISPYTATTGDKVYPLMVDIKKGAVGKEIFNVTFTTNDINTAYMLVTLYNGNKPYLVDGTAVTMHMMLPDRTNYVSIGKVVGENIVEFPLGEACLRTKGNIMLDIEVSRENNKILTTPVMYFPVTKAIELNEVITDDDRIPELSTLLFDVRNLQQQLEQLIPEAEGIIANGNATIAEVIAITNASVAESKAKVDTMLSEARVDLVAYKESTTTDIQTELGAYEASTTDRVDAEVRASLTQYQNTTTANLDADFKDYETRTTTNIDNKFNAKATEIDTRVNNKITELETSVDGKLVEVDGKIAEVELSEAGRVERHAEMVTELQGYSTDVANLKSVTATHTEQINTVLPIVDDHEFRLNQTEATVDNHSDRLVVAERYNKTHDILLDALYKEDMSERITITEEGSVISLPQSKNGLVKVEELQGNTLVNYCTDGATELILNGDIDTEGTFVTTAEGVDGGMVDVMCEGNTLVNLVQNKTSDLFGLSGSGTNFDRLFEENSCTYTTKSNTNQYITIRTGSKDLLKPNTSYTIVFDILENTIPNYKGVAIRGVSDCYYTTIHPETRLFLDTQYVLDKKKHKISFTTHSDLTIYSGFGFGFPSVSNVDEGLKFKIGNVILLEGDWTDKEIPPYFEGMKSVGEGLDKFEILSNNANIFNMEDTSSTTLEGIRYEVLNDTISIIGTNTGNSYRYFNIDNVIKHLKLNYSYYISIEVEGSFEGMNLAIGGDDNNWLVSFPLDMSKSRIFSIKQKLSSIRLTNASSTSGTCICNGTLKISISKENRFTSHSLNKKEILLNEPLRGLPNGVKDRFVKIGGKWYVERNCIGFIMTNVGNPVNNGIVADKQRWQFHYSGIKPNSISLCNKYTTVINDDEAKAIPYDNIRCSTNIVWLYCMDTNTTMEQAKTKVEGIEIVAELNAPTYEPITDPTLICYLDTTHISNNSIIPCNMKIKNTGYNTIIKPNTQYTVALDTNKSGTIGLNLGGSKVTTTNNVALITTPSTLTDDSLRVSGKGITSKNVRLLEGTHTNIPSMFNGMMSCFEDKDNVIELMSVNDGDLWTDSFINAGISSSNGVQNTWTNYSVSQSYTEIFSNARYAYKATLSMEPSNVFIYLYDKNKDFIKTIIITGDGKTEKAFSTENARFIRVGFNGTGMTKDKVLDFKLCLGDYISSKKFIQNKIQFLLNEPLRGVGNIKDRFVFIDGKLLIERNFKQINFMPTTVINNPLGTYQLIRMTKTKDMFGYGNGYGGWTKMDKHSEFTTLGDTWQQIDKIGQYSTRISSSVIDIAFRLNSFSSLDDAKTYFTNNATQLTYRLLEPTYEEIPSDLQYIILECYENGTLFIDTIIPPTVSVTYSANIPIVTKMNELDEMNIDLVATSWDMDYRVCEIEWFLEDALPVALGNGLKNILNSGGSTMALSRYEQAKIMILGGAYDDATLRRQLSSYLKREYLTQEEYDELIAMMDARLLVEGK